MNTKAVEIKNLDFTYPDGTAALFAVDLDVFAGESLGIIGPNGAGKSTLLLQLNGILKGTGSVKIFDTQVEDKNLPEIRRRVGLVFQDPDNQLFMPTVFDDVAFGPVNMGFKKNEVEAAVDKALIEVDMLKAKLKPSHHLSFGEKKRVSIATVLSMEPEILVLDEPSSNLDSKHRRQLIELLKKLNHTKIIATHDLDLVSRTCSRAALLDNGRIVASGLCADILGSKSLLESHNF